MQKVSRAISIIAVLCSLLMMAGLVSAQEQSPEELCYQKSGMWNYEENKCQVSAGVEVALDYPLSLVGTGIPETDIDTFLNGLKSNFLNEYLTMGAIPEPGIPSFPWSMYGVYEEFSHHENFISLKFDIYSFTGGAHGNSFIETFNYDLATGQRYTIADMFNDEAVWDVIVPFVQETLQANMGDMADTNWIQEGTAAGHFEDFVLTADSIIFYFEPYLVAPYAAGTQQVSVPLANVQMYLNAPFAP